MIVDQEEIEALLTQADSLVKEADQEVAQPAPPPPPRAAPAAVVASSPEVARILRLRVPVRVQLAACRMTISAIRRFSLGMIVEFHKSVDEPLDLLINNHPIGKGDAVKVGEHFGLRISQIRDTATRIRSMGR